MGLGRLVTLDSREISALPPSARLLTKRWLKIWQGERCQFCYRNRLVRGDNVLTCRSRLVFIGEAPSREEDKGGRPFVGQAGLEFNAHYLALAGLDRDDVYVTNTCKCRPPQNKKPGVKEIAGCTELYLKRELEVIEPELIVLMGGTANSLAPEIDLETHHGIPQVVELFGVERLVFPTYHPALGLHDTGKITQLREDFTNLGRFLRGERYWAEDKLEHEYSLIKGEEVQAVGRRVVEPARFYLAVDTESVDGRTWMVQFSTEPGRAYAFMAEDKRALHCFKQILLAMEAAEERAKLVFHFRQADEPALAELGVLVPGKVVVRDTMQRAFHQCNLPQGLKPLSYRVCGMKLRDYQDVVGPYSREKALDWMGDALLSEHCRKIRYEVESPRTGRMLSRVKSNPVATAVKRIARYTQSNPKYSPWEKWEEFVDRVMIAEAVSGDLSSRVLARSLLGELGKMPTAGLHQVPIGEVVEYACGDADATGRVELELERRAREFGREAREAIA